MKETQERLQELERRTRQLPPQTRASLSEALEEWRNTLTELSAAGEKLRAQNEALLMARYGVEAERQRYQELFEFAPDGYLVTDANGKIHEANRSAAALLNVPLSQLIGRLLAAFVAPDGRHAFRAVLGGAAPPVGSHGLEVHLQPEGGAPFPALLSVSHSQVKDEQKPGLRWMLRDITTLHDAKRSAEESRAQLAGIVDSAMDAIITVDEEQRVVLFNSAAEQMFGCSAAEALGNRLDRFIPERFLEAYRRHIVQFARGTQPMRTVERSGTVFGLRASGEEFPIEASISKTRTTGTKLFTVILRDVTERRRAEEALRESERRFRAFMDHSPAVAFLKDEAGRYLYVNKVCETAFQRRPADWLGKTDEELFPAAIAEELRRHDRAALNGNAVLETEEMVPCPQGDRRDWWVFKFPIELSERQRVLGGVGIDITARKEADAKLVESQRQIEQSREELRSLSGRLINAQEEERRRLAHDLHDHLNQRIALLSIEIELLQRALSAAPAEIRSRLNSLREKISQLSDEVQDLAQGLHPSLLQDLGLVKALNEHLQEFGALRGIRTTIRSQRAWEGLPADIALSLFRIAQESLHNVAKHSGASAISIRLMGTSRGIGMSVSDNGAGFDPEQVRSSSGGLGLMSMEERANLLGGRCRVRSRQGQGTQVTVWIPIPGGDP